ncbi:MAG: hypothetical protein JNM88_09395 [Chitinophagaceae bacterium]|nr:hypothetical protein [Chitinophagaceae bacterium]
MAKQKGFLKLIGTYGDVTFVQTADGFIAKQKTSVTKSRLMTDPSFIRTRENMAEFGTAGKAAKLLRNSMLATIKAASDPRASSRLTGYMSKVVKADPTGARGQRKVVQANLDMLKGFNFNGQNMLNEVFNTPITATIDRPGGKLAIDIASFVPSAVVTPAQGATHIRIISAGAEVDFDGETYVSQATVSDPIPLNAVPTANIHLENQVTAASTKGLFLLAGIQFCQEVNGVAYPLSNLSFNALSIVEVSVS